MKVEELLAISYMNLPSSALDEGYFHSVNDK